MRKNWMIGFIIASLCMGSTATMATTTATLTEEMEFVGISTSWEDMYEAPKVRITIEDAYKKAGEKEKILISLKDAYWNAIGLQIYDVKGIDISDIAKMNVDNAVYQLNVSIPSDIKEGEKIEIEIALPVTVTEKEPRVNIAPGAGAELIETHEVLIGASDIKKVTYKVQDIPTIVDHGVMAPILLTELRHNSLGSEEMEITLELKDVDFRFGDFEYISKQENVDNTDYILEGEDYITYGGGFEREEEKQVKLKCPNKSDQKITFRVRGTATSSIGTILLHDIPVETTNTSSMEKEVIVTIKGKNLVNTEQDIVVAYMQTSAYLAEETDKAAEEAAKEEAEAEERDRQKIEDNENFGIKFTVGKSTYTVNGLPHEMDVAPTIWGKGYTMVPIRYVALAFGVAEQDIWFQGGRMKFTYGSREIELLNGTNVALVNGTPIQMEVPLMIIGERTFAPIGELAKIMGVEKKWDHATKTAIFY